MQCFTRKLPIFLEWLIWSRECHNYCDWWYAGNLSIRISNDDILFEKEERFCTTSTRKWVSEYAIRMNRQQRSSCLSLSLSASLVPVISFGENEHYRRSNNRILNQWLWGRSIIGYLPLRHPVTAVGKTRLLSRLDSREQRELYLILLVGKPIHVAQIIHPSQTDIDQLHQEYIQALEHLYDMEKAKYGFENVELKII